MNHAEEARRILGLSQITTYAASNDPHGAATVHALLAILEHLEQQGQSHHFAAGSL